MPTLLAQPETQAALNRAIRVFNERFGGEPGFAADAPGRANLIGDHTDYNGGFVLPIAIDRRCVCVGAFTTSRGGAGRLRVASADTGDAATLDLARTGPTAASGGNWPDGAATRGETPGAVRRGSWLSYIAGVVAGFCRRPEWPSDAGLDLAVASDVPIGSGLASSAALEVAVAASLAGALGVSLEPVETALLCQQAEHEFAGVPCGLMDQLTAAAARPGHAMLIDCSVNEFNYLKLPPSAPDTAPRRVGRPAQNEPPRPADRAAFLIVDSRVRHSLAAGEYRVRRETCASAAKKLGVKNLCDADRDVLDRSRLALTPDEYAFSRHVIGENARVTEAASALRAGDILRFGRLMNESHDSLRDDFRVSTRELDSLATIARRVDGVYGARMTGAGFGGCVVVMIRPDAADRVLRHIVKRYRDLLNIRTGGFVAQADGAARVISLSA